MASPGAHVAQPNEMSKTDEQQKKHTSNQSSVRECVMSVEL